MIRTIDEVKDLLKRYCAEIGIPENDLFIPYKNTGRLRKKNNCVRFHCIRMAIGYYVIKNSRIPMKDIGPAVGYADHSTLSARLKHIEHYIKTEDPVFYPYWEKLLNIA